jgi:hypothetical protein
MLQRLFLRQNSLSLADIFMRQGNRGDVGPAAYYDLA